MYSPEVTARAVAKASDRLGFEVTPHSPDQIDAARSLLDDLWDVDAGKFKRNLAPDEQTFITNERTLCALDFRYWLANYSLIVGWTKRPQRCVPNVAQSIILDLWAESEAKAEAIWMQQLKARRLGVSTISELAIQHRFQFHPYTNAVIASADPDKTVEMAGIIDFCLSAQPWWLKPVPTKIFRGVPVEHGDIHTTLTIQAGNQFNGVARGSSPNVIHLSELCEWRGADELIDGALMPAILDTPDVFGILESTASGPGWWKDKWEQNKKDWPRGRGRVRPVFLPWYVGVDLFPTEADLRKRPIPADWIPSDRTITHAERARQYVLTNPLLLKYLAKGRTDWQMPKAQMWWREVGYETAKEEKKLHIYLAEFCSDDFEAFQAINHPIIDPEVMIAYKERTREPKGVYTIIGPDIPNTLVSPRRYWDTSKPPITIDARELVLSSNARYQLVPLLFTGYPDLDEDLKLLVWEHPDDQYTYGLGTDCSEGIGENNAAIEVLREATPLRCPGQVAEWVSSRVTAFQMWPMTLAVACFYSTYSQRAQRRVQSRLAIETWTNGSVLQNELQKRGWTNFHPWKYNDTKKPRKDADVTLIGVRTNAWFRQSMMDMLLTSLSEESLDLPSPFIVRELEGLQRVTSRKVAAPGDEKDDRIMALGFPLFSLHMNKPALRQYARQRVDYAAGMDEQDTVAYAVWQPGSQETGIAGLSQQILRGRQGRPNGLNRLVNNRMPRGFR